MGSLPLEGTQKPPRVRVPQLENHRRVLKKHRRVLLYTKNGFLKIYVKKIYTYTLIYVYTYINIYVHTYAYTCKHMCIDTHMYL